MAYNKETGCWVGYIYCIENKVNGKKYIGQTTQTIEKRWMDHIYKLKYSNKLPALHNAIKKYGKENFDVYELVYIESKNQEDVVDNLNELEVFFIELHNTLVNNGNGYNIHIGGNSRKQYNPICVYDINGNLLNEFFNIQDTANYYNTTAKVVRNVCNGVCRNYKKSMVFRFKCDDFNKYPTEKRPCIHMQKKVDVYDANTLKYINTFESFGKCSKDLNVTCACIYGVCKGLTQQSHGYIFRYHGDPLDKYSMEIKYSHRGNVRNIGRAVNQYDKDLNYINTYTSIQGASKVTGAHYTNISDCCSHRKKSSGGFKWFYADDPNQPDKTKIIA